MPDAADPRASTGEGRDAGLAHVIVTVLALYARVPEGWISIADLVTLMADLDVDHQPVRSAVSRLKRRGAIVSEKRHGAAGYRLPEATLELLAEGDARIFERRRATRADGWVLAVFSVPESERTRRHRLRALLTRLGFGTVAPGVWIAPGTLEPETRHALARQGLESYVDLFVGRYATGEDLPEQVGSWWDLNELASLYEVFVDEFEGVREIMHHRRPEPREAFRLYVPLLTQWRRLPYRDPGLPLDVLPAAWPGERAWALFDEVNSTLGPLAHAHASRVIQGGVLPA